MLVWIRVYRQFCRSLNKNWMKNGLSKSSIMEILFHRRASKERKETASVCEYSFCFPREDGEKFSLFYQTFVLLFVSTLFLLLIKVENLSSAFHVAIVITIPMLFSHCSVEKYMKFIDDRYYLHKLSAMAIQQKCIRVPSEGSLKPSCRKVHV